MRKTLSIIAVVTCVMHISAAYADNAPAAETLFNEGKKLGTQGKWQEACLKFEESQRIDPGIGTLFQLANCHERIGKTASAWAEFREVAASSKASGQAAREKVARERAAALENKLARLTITVDGDAPGLTVRRDGTDVGRAQWGSPIAVDPGTHRIEALAPGKRPWEQTVRVDHAQKITARVPVLETEAVAATPVAPAPAPVESATAAAPPPQQEGQPEPSPVPVEPRESGTPGSSQRVAGGALFGLGVAGLGVGTVFGLLSKSARDDSAAHCRADNRCDRTGVELRDDAMRNGTIATVAFGVGAAGLVTGTVLWLSAPSSKEQAARVRIVPLAATGGGGLSVSGGF